MKSAVVAPVAVLILATGSSLAATHKPYVILWNQNDNFGSGVNSQTYESSLSADDDAAADDFYVPSGQVWQIAEVDVTGAYVGGNGPASSVQISIYKTKRKRPRTDPIHTYTVSCTDNDGSFQCILPTRHALMLYGPATYWVSVVANCASTVCGQWQWTENTAVTGYQAMWRNPEGGLNASCRGFSPISDCFGGAPVDLAFDLIGTP